MKRNRCVRAPSLVGPKRWLPSEAFDYGWGQFGCNQLRCGHCGEAVSSELHDAFRRYACACASRDEYDVHMMGADAGHIHEFTAAWDCAGHPLLPLPIVLDGVELSAVAPFAAIVRQALADPPFTAPGFRTRSFWVQRLFRLLPTAAQQIVVGQAVSTQLSSDDPQVARAAMDFFIDLPWAPGAAEVAVVAKRDRERLAAIPDPLSQTQGTLYRRITEAVEAGLIIRDDAGAVVDPAALELARQALVTSEAATGMIFRVASSDPAWFCDHAADIVRAKPKRLDFVMEALKTLPRDGQLRAVHDLRAISKATDKAVRGFIEDNPELAGLIS